MRGLRQALGMVVFGAIIVAGTHSVLAQGLWGPGTWSVYGFGARSWSTSRPGPPYFPVHPPVYYGRQVRMVYGDSPLVRSPRATSGVSQAERREAAAEPPVGGQWITNPFFESDQTNSAAQATDGNRSAAPVPGMIENPFFRPSGSSAAESTSGLGRGNRLLSTSRGG